jgi:hypothetical protein
MSEQTHQLQTETTPQSRWLFSALIGDKFGRPIEASIDAIPLQLMFDELPNGDELEVKADPGGTANFDFLYWSNASDKEAAIAKSIASLIPLLKEVGVEEPIINIARVGTSYGDAVDVTQFAVRTQEDLEQAHFVESSADFEI